MSKTRTLVLSFVCNAACIVGLLTGLSACGGGAANVDACHVRDVTCAACDAACAATESHCSSGGDGG